MRYRKAETNKALDDARGSSPPPEHVEPPTPLGRGRVGGCWLDPGPSVNARYKLCGFVTVSDLYRLRNLFVGPKNSHFRLLITAVGNGISSVRVTNMCNG